MNNLFIGLCRYCPFKKWKICGNPVTNKSISSILPTISPHLVSLYQILVILIIVQSFSSLLYLLWWCYSNCFGSPQTSLYYFKKLLQPSIATAVNNHHLTSQQQSVSRQGLPLPAKAVRLTEAHMMAHIKVYTLCFLDICKTTA